MRNLKHLYSFFQFTQLFIKYLIYVRHCPRYLEFIETKEIICLRGTYAQVEPLLTRVSMNLDILVSF